MRQTRAQTAPREHRGRARAPEHAALRPRRSARRCARPAKGRALHRTARDRPNVDRAPAEPRTPGPPGTSLRGLRMRLHAVGVRNAARRVRASPIEKKLLLLEEIVDGGF